MVESVDSDSQLYEQITPPEGVTFLAVFMDGCQPFVGGIGHTRHTDTLKACEQTFGLRRSDRTDKDAQLDLRARVFATAREAGEGLATVAPGLMSAIYWLAINHYSGADALKAQLSDMIREQSRATLSVSVEGDDQVMRWMFSVGLHPMDARTISDEFPKDTPILVQFSDDTPPPTFS